MSETRMTIESVHIVRMPGVCGGKPCIGGTRIRVQDVYLWHELQGKSPDEIVSSFPQLTLADVYAALAYFWDHRDEILQQMKEEEAVAARLRAEFPSKITLKLRGNGDAVSP